MFWCGDRMLEALPYSTNGFHVSDNFHASGQKHGEVLVGSLKKVPHITPSNILLVNTQSLKYLGNKVQMRTQKEKEAICFDEQLTDFVFRVFFSFIGLDKDFSTQC